MIKLEEIKAQPLFEGMEEEKFGWLCDNLVSVGLGAGEYLVRLGDEAKGFFLLLEGDIEVTTEMNGHEMRMGEHKPGNFFGEVQVLSGEEVPVSLRAETDCRLLNLKTPAFFELMSTCDLFRTRIFKTVSDRLRGLERFKRQREKMASLGTLSAGLTHELNNPASSLKSDIGRLGEIVSDIQSLLLDLAAANVGHAQLTELEALNREIEDEAANIVTDNPIAVGEGEEEIEDWLDDHGFEKSWEVASTFYRRGWSPSAFAKVERIVGEDGCKAALKWLIALHEMNTIIDQSSVAADRIVNMISAVKSYSFMDQGVQQDIDIHDGIEDTLTILHYKLKQGVSVVRNFDRSLPKIAAYGSELNQVWTNIIDNAIDAMNGSGQIEITTRRHDNRVCVEIEDNGPGIPDEIMANIFDPFFTTKPVGQGSGLGLDVTYRAVVNRHNGDIDVKSEPGSTKFSVYLPIGPAVH